MGRLGSRLWVCASFQIFALTLGGGNVLGWGGKLSRDGNVWKNMCEGNVRRECPPLACQNVILPAEHLTD